MLKIHRQHIEAVNAAESLKDLFPLVQNAIELEHATISTLFDSHVFHQTRKKHKTSGTLFTQL